jgi:hypothetical protein
MDALAMGPYWIERPEGLAPTGVAPSPHVAHAGEVDLRSARIFGVGLAVVSLLLISFVFGWKPKPQVVGLIAIGSCGLIGALFFPRWLHRAQQGIESVVRGVLSALAKVLLALVYWIVVTPTGWCKRISTPDALCRELSDEVDSYWTPVEWNAEQHDYERMF